MKTENYDARQTDGERRYIFHVEVKEPKIQSVVEKTLSSNTSLIDDEHQAVTGQSICVTTVTLPTHTHTHTPRSNICRAKIVVKEFSLYHTVTTMTTPCRSSSSSNSKCAMTKFLLLVALTAGMVPAAATFGMLAPTHSSRLTTRQFGTDIVGVQRETGRTAVVNHFHPLPSQSSRRHSPSSSSLSMSPSSAVSNLVGRIRGGAASTTSASSASSILESIKNWNSTPTALFNTSLLAVALLVVTFKVISRESRSDDAASAKTAKPQSVVQLQRKFLSVFWLLRCADWLQGPYFYEVYASKVFNGVQASMALVSRLFLTGFASTALFGPVVGRAVDTYGRKKGTLAFSVLYAMGALSTKSPLLGVLLFGRVLSGIGTSLLFSAPESWLVAESQKSGDDPDGKYLGETFGLVC